MHSISGHVPRRNKMHGSGAHSRALLRLYENESKLTWKAYLAGSTASLWFYQVERAQRVVLPGAHELLLTRARNYTFPAGFGGSDCL